MFEPVKCPKDCVYRMNFHYGMTMCGYILITERMRGCDPGPGCIRYTTGTKKKNVLCVKPRGVKASWDTDAGYRMYLEGKTDRQIADALGMGSVRKISEYRKRHWEKKL